MLNVDSKRVIYEYGDLTLGDSVYSVLGILKSVQKKTKTENTAKKFLRINT